MPDEAAQVVAELRDLVGKLRILDEIPAPLAQPPGELLNVLRLESRREVLRELWRPGRLQGLGDVAGLEAAVAVLTPAQAFAARQDSESVADPAHGRIRRQQPRVLQRVVPARS